MKLAPFRQERPETCLPAAIRMVLHHWGRDYSEKELVEICGTVPRFGTPPDAAVAGLEKAGYGALWFENATLERLIRLLEQNWPVIIFLPASALPHGRSGFHAIVLTAVKEREIVAMDPALGKEFRMALNAFLRAWALLDNQGMVVWVSASENSE